MTHRRAKSVLQLGETLVDCGKRQLLECDVVVQVSRDFVRNGLFGDDHGVIL